jgi:hypothetical protein
LAKRALCLVGLMFLSACVTHTTESGPGAAIAPALSVETFLQAANQNDLRTMARVFGSQDGPVANTGSSFGCAFKKLGSWIGLSDSCMSRQQVELWMNTIAMVIKHDDYRITGDATVPGRVAQTTRVDVSLTQGPREVQNVPFLVVRDGEGRWLVEEIGLERITSR